MPSSDRFFSVLARAKKRVMGFFVDNKEIEDQLRSKDRATPSAAPEKSTPLVSATAGKPRQQRPAGLDKSVLVSATAGKPRPQSPSGVDQSAPQQLAQPDYEGFGLTVQHKNVAFLKDPRFMAAYQRGMTSGHRYPDYVRLEWNVHVCCWAATQAKRLPGDFVECGVSTGIYSLAVCEYIDFNATGKKLWLFDTFAGLPESQMSPAESERNRQHADNERVYFDCWDLVQRNFANYPNAHLIRGLVPETLPQAKVEQVSYLCLDMNIAAPERAAIEYFWPKLVPGAVVIVDDYGWRGYEEQKATMDEFAARMGIEVLALPTGQGLIIKT